MKGKKRREYYKLKRLGVVIPSGEATDSVPSPAKRSATPILKEVPSHLPNKFKYQLDNLDILLKHNTDSPASPEPEIDMVHIKETSESQASPDQ